MAAKRQTKQKPKRNGTNNTRSPRASRKPARSVTPSFPQYRVTPLAKQPAITRYLRTVADPWRYAFRGISGTHPTPNTCVVRRRQLLPFTIAGSIGADIYFPLENVNQPWLVCSEPTTPGWNTITRTIVGNGALSNVPVGAIARTVGAGIRLTATGAAQSVGGMFFLYRSAAGGSDDQSGFMPDLAEGAVRTTLDECITRANMVAGKTLTLVCPPIDNWYTIDAASSDQGTGTCVTPAYATPVAPASFPLSEHLRLYYIGPPGSFLAEVVQVVEYYVDAHKDFASAAVSHPSGSAITSVVATAMSGGNSHIEAKGGHGGFLTFVERAAQTVDTVSAALVSVGKAAWTGKKLYDGFTALAAPVAEYGAVMLA